MKSEIFNLDFSRIEILLLALIPVVINIGIFVYVTFYIQSTKATDFFSFFVLMLGLWQLSEGFMRMSIAIDAVEKWNRISEIFVLLVILFGLLFTIFFTKREKKINWNILLLYIVFPGIVFFSCIILQLNDYRIVKSTNWYWIVNPQSTPITAIIYLWVSLGALTMFFLFWLHYFKKRKVKIEQKQAFLLAVGISIPILIGIIAEVIMPLILKVDGIPVTASLTTIFSVMSLIAIKKYRLSEFSPKHQWDDIVKSMSEGILIVDNNDEIKYANEGFCKLSGYEFFEMEGKNATQLFASAENNRKMVQTRIEDRKQNKSSQYELQITTKSGEKKWLLVGGSPFVDKNGKVIGSIGIHANINDRKIAEENLLESNSELEIFVYKASHDLRGPLASIIGLVNVSNYEIKDKAAIEYLKMIGESTKKLDYTLIELVKTMKIKDIRRFDDLIDFNKLIETKLGEFKYFTGFDNLKISVNVSLEREFYSNNFLLETIFQNLIENAIKYQNDSSSQPFLKIEVASFSNKIQIIFEDNGIGIKSSVQGMIFDMYYKAVESSKGSGLGLYLVKKCVEKLDGEIELRSFIGKGSTFIITLFQDEAKH